MNIEIPDDLLLLTLNLTVLAGRSIMEVYKKPFDVEYKEDNSPLTEADKISNDIISSGLKTTKYPYILSEEMAEAPYDERKNWKQFWLVDPLDGTKEFVKRNGEFTVNIALINEGAPVFGVIYLPVPQTLYFAVKDKGAFRIVNAGNITYQWIEQVMDAAERLPLFQPKRDYTIVASRSQMPPETETFISEETKKHGKVNTVSAEVQLSFA